MVIKVEQLFTVLEQWRTVVPKVNWALSRSIHTKCYPAMWLKFLIEYTAQNIQGNSDNFSTLVYIWSIS